MIDHAKIIEKAKSSSFYLKVLNWSLGRMIPFNKPHGFRIVALDDHHIRTVLPYRRKNLNHIRGLHACALATLSEFTTGFLLVSRLDAARYRLIMQRLDMEYHFQGKMDAVADFLLPEDWFEQHVLSPLRSRDAIIIPCEIRTYDLKGNHLATGKVFWQIKEWSKVRTKVTS